MEPQAVEMEVMGSNVGTKLMKVEVEVQGYVAKTLFRHC